MRIKQTTLQRRGKGGGGLGSGRGWGIFACIGVFRTSNYVELLPNTSATMPLGAAGRVWSIFLFDVMFLMFDVLLLMCIMAYPPRAHFPHANRTYLFAYFF